MTLVIGINCPEGIALVSDRKLTDIENPENAIYEDKINLLPNTQVGFVASGITDLFRQFYRRIGILIDQRQRETRIKNEVELRKVGRTLRDYEVQIELPETIQGKEDVKKEKQEAKPREDYIQPPYIYTGEHFIGDCKALMEEIGAEGSKFASNPLDLLVAFNTGIPSLFHINSQGYERQIDKYIAIGSGSPFVKKFFDRLWKPDGSLDQAILTAVFVIKYVEHLKTDPFVGCREIDDFPQIIVFLKDGRYGNYGFEEKEELLKGIKKKTGEFEKLIFSLAEQDKSPISSQG